MSVSLRSLRMRSVSWKALRLCVMTVTLLSSFAVRMPSKRSRMSEQIPISFSTSKLEMGSSSTMY